MKIKSLVIIVMAVMLFVACNHKKDNKEKTQSEMEKYNKGTFGYDAGFLSGKGKIITLKNEAGNAQLIVSPKYQGKVFTSTAEGNEGKSFGWINYKAFDSTDPHMNGYGSEDRLWLGPEGGKFSIFFKPGTKMEFDNWHTPPAFDSESWELDSATNKTVSMSKDMSLQNYAGTVLKIKITRNVQIFENSDIEKALNIKLGSNVKSVGFQTDNTLINAGDIAWTQQTGAPCLWNLDMFPPSPETVIVVPYNESVSGKVATTDYFGQIPPDRVTYKNGILLFKADGKSRGKLGIPPHRAKPVNGSYDAKNNVLTITSFDVDNKGTYLNQEWTPDKDPLTGDAVNAYNDGPLQNGSQMGPFYEIESVSPAAFLKPKEKLNHKHSVFHFIGNKEELNLIAEKVLGISLNQIESAFNNKKI